ncbi:hypothetical protein V5799_005647 [Amblyomma americanum]|uniref:SWIM-type domain-containing protein n=1 Tax=Amblyomma americanum TaxID=6943 RepID=A0AAQ4DYN1_AMBAM
MAAVVLRYGFKKIAGIEDYFHRGVLEKGKKLCAANYVYGVEEYCPGNDVASVVTAKCHSQVQQDEYNVNIKLSSPRQIFGAACTCKAGVGGSCMHVAAVAVCISDEDTPSSTDLPQAWGRRTSKPDTSNRESIEELFGDKLERLSCFHVE